MSKCAGTGTAYGDAMMNGQGACGEVRLRAVTRADLEWMYECQLDAEINVMAGTKPRSRDVYFANWEKHCADQSLRARVIEVDGAAAGTIACFEAEGKSRIGYWVARELWGRGICTRAVKLLLEEEARRLLYATARSNHAASRRVLEKCGFEFVNEEMGVETERYLACEIVNYVLRGRQ